MDDVAPPWRLPQLHERDMCSCVSSVVHSSQALDLKAHSITLDTVVDGGKSSTPCPCKSAGEVC